MWPRGTFDYSQLTLPVRSLTAENRRLSDELKDGPLRGINGPITMGHEITAWGFQAGLPSFRAGQREVPGSRKPYKSSVKSEMWQMKKMLANDTKASFHK